MAITTLLSRPPAFLTNVFSPSETTWFKPHQLTMPPTLPSPTPQTDTSPHQARTQPRPNPQNDNLDSKPRYPSSLPRVIQTTHRSKIHATHRRHRTDIPNHNQSGSPGFFKPDVWSLLINWQSRLKWIASSSSWYSSSSSFFEFRRSWLITPVPDDVYQSYQSNYKSQIWEHVAPWLILEVRAAYLVQYISTSPESRWRLWALHPPKTSGNLRR